MGTASVNLGIWIPDRAQWGGAQVVHNGITTSIRNIQCIHFLSDGKEGNMDFIPYCKFPPISDVIECSFSLLLTQLIPRQK